MGTPFCQILGWQGFSWVILGGSELGSKNIENWGPCGSSEMKSSVERPEQRLSVWLCLGKMMDSVMMFKDVSVSHRFTLLQSGDAPLFSSWSMYQFAAVGYSCNNQCLGSLSSLDIDLRFLGFFLGKSCCLNPEETQEALFSQTCFITWIRDIKSILANFSLWVN